MNSAQDTLSGGLPHSEIPGSPIARISPGLFAACHVLHRLSVPRHPPDALSLRLMLITPPRTGARPRTQAASHEDTSSDTPCKLCLHLPTGEASLRRKGAPLRQACPPRSHDKLSLHPSINIAARLARTVSFKSSPNADGGGAKMVEVNGIEPMTSCLQSRRSPN
jgi:hypothetical protein